MGGRTDRRQPRGAPHPRVNLVHNKPQHIHPPRTLSRNIHHTHTTRGTAPAPTPPPSPSAPPHQLDVLTPKGQLAALQGVLGLRPGGVLGGGPPCSLFVFMSASVHKRTATNPSGDLCNAGVCRANRIVHFWCSLVTLSAMRGCFWWTEQPGSSRMYELPCFVEVLATMPLYGYSVVRQWVWLGAFGHELLKGSAFVGTWPRLSALARSRPEKPAASLAFYKKTESGRVSGGHALSGSQEYPKEFTDTLAELYTLDRFEGLGAGDVQAPQPGQDNAGGSSSASLASPRSWRACPYVCNVCRQHLTSPPACCWPEHHAGGHECSRCNTAVADGPSSKKGRWQGDQGQTPE